MGLLLARDQFLKRNGTGRPRSRACRPRREDCASSAPKSRTSRLRNRRHNWDLAQTPSSASRWTIISEWILETLRSALESLHAQDLLPMAIVATAGTTDFGSIDPLPELSLEIGHPTRAWLHVDAAYGGALLFSRRHRETRRHRSADSLSIDFHKLLWQPIPCSVFLLRDAPTSIPSKCTPTTSTQNSTRKKASRIWSRLPCSPAAASTPSNCGSPSNPSAGETRSHDRHARSRWPSTLQRSCANPKGWNCL